MERREDIKGDSPKVMSTLNWNGTGYSLMKKIVLLRGGVTGNDCGKQGMQGIMHV
jgi:hypothetical protein